MIIRDCAARYGAPWGFAITRRWDEISALFETVFSDTFPQSVRRGCRRNARICFPNRPMVRLHLVQVTGLRHVVQQRGKIGYELLILWWKGRDLFPLFPLPQALDLA
jgi:hypothetical protein